jgi:hypothetical protein
MGWLRKFLPWSRWAIGLWAWRNRRQLLGWASFGADAVPRLVTGGSSDVLAEARLRIALTRDPFARGARDLHVRVVDGEAILRGRVPSPIRRAAFEAARRTKGIRHVRDEIQDLPDRSRRSRRRSPPA